MYIHQCINTGMRAHIGTTDVLMLMMPHLRMQRFYSRLLGEARGDAAVALQGAMVSMIRDRRVSVMQWAAFVCYGLPAAELPAQADENASGTQLQAELQDLFGARNLLSKCDLALEWFKAQGYASMVKMLEADKSMLLVTEEMQRIDPDKMLKANKEMLVTKEMELVISLGLKPGKAKLLLMDLKAQRC